MRVLLNIAIICLVWSLNTAIADDRPTTYVPPDGYASTTGAKYIEPSITKMLIPGQQISNYTARAFAGEIMLQKLTERSYWIGTGFLQYRVLCR